VIACAASEVALISQLLRVRSFLLVILSLGAVLWSSVAFAAGRVEWKEKELKEREGGSWRLELAFYMPSAPDVAHVPMKFEFQPIAYYERSMVDGDKLIERTVPLEHRQSLIESVDVGFLDSGTGKIEKRTRFSFKVTRAHGYEAGEYKVTIKDGRNGNTVGTPVTLKFNGENEIIDRRAMVFTGKKEKKEKKEGEAKEGEAKEGPGDSSSAGEGEKEKAAEPAAESSEEPAAEESGTSDGPPPIEEKPGGCGCRLHETGSAGSSAGVLALALGVLLGARRRRSRA
jgi:MYXO-CTERM domain-containing protein